MIRALALAGMIAGTVAGAQEQVSVGTGAVLRGLDKVSGDLRDITLRPGESARFGRVTVELAQCRFPAGNPAGDAYAFLSIREDGSDIALFQGWMIASSPALNALDHPRYDIWVMRCTTPE